MNDFEEISVYKKKKASNVSKSKKKSNHKHDYQECLIEYPLENYLKNDQFKEKVSVCNATYCKICGKLNDSKFHNAIKEWNESLNHFVYRSLTNEERKEQYKDLPYFKIKTPFQDYIPISEINNNDFDIEKE